MSNSVKNHHLHGQACCQKNFFFETNDSCCWVCDNCEKQQTTAMTSSTQQRVNTVLKNDLGLVWAMGIIEILKILTQILVQILLGHMISPK